MTFFLGGGGGGAGGGRFCQCKNFTDKLPTPETHGETGSFPPKKIPESNGKMLILLFYVLKRCFLGSLWVDRPSLSVSFRSGQ